MNFLIGAIGAHVTLSLLSGITSTANGIYSLSTNIKNATSIGAKEVKQIIKETDLEVNIKTIQFLLCEIKLTENSPYTLQYCIQSIRDCIKDISEELEKIHYRMQYNDNLWYGQSLRSYKFHNCRERLDSHIKNLKSRRKALIEILKIENTLYKNNDLETSLNQSVVLVDKIDVKSAEIIRKDLQKKLEFMKN
jgi:hypothetical protein